MTAHALRDPQLRLHWAARIDYAEDSGVEAHAHADYQQLLLVLEGCGELELCGETIPLARESYYWFREGVSHRFSFAAPAVTLDFKFEVADAAVAAWLRGRTAHGPLTPDAVADWKRAFRETRALPPQEAGIGRLKIDSLFKTCLLTLLEDSSGGCREPRSTSRPDFEIAAYLHEYIHEEITIERLARRFNFHPHYLISMFTERVGCSPIHYLQRIRLEQAREDLEFTTLPIQRIAERIGWTAPYFSRLFRARMGVSPSAYRDERRLSVGKDIVVSDAFTNVWRIRRHGGRGSGETGGMRRQNT